MGLDDVDHVLITHLHGDHVGGLEQLLFWRRFVTNRQATPPRRARGAGRALGHAAPRAAWRRSSTRPGGPARTLGLDDYADVVPLAPGENRIGELTLEHRPTIHHIPTSAIRVRAGSKSVGYSADTAFDPSLMAWLAESDLFFHETNLGVHTPLASLAALPAEIRARMRLIHYPDFLDLDSSPIPARREGERLRSVTTPGVSRGDATRGNVDAARKRGSLGGSCREAAPTAPMEGTTRPPTRSYVDALLRGNLTAD